MAFAMVYAMICYNIAINRGGMTNEVFLLAFHEVIIMWPVAFVLEMFVVERLAKMLAFRLVSPDDKPIFILLAISSMIVCLMCPMMSLVATILFQNPGKEIIALWFQTTVLNFPYKIPLRIRKSESMRIPTRTAISSAVRNPTPSMSSASRYGFSRIIPYTSCPYC